MFNLFWHDDIRTFPTRSQAFQGFRTLVRESGYHWADLNARVVSHASGTVWVPVPTPHGLRGYVWQQQA